MSQEITQAMVSQYSSNVYMLAQQRVSRLARVVDNERVRGEQMFVERVGTVEPVKRVSRHGDTPFTEVPHSRRMLTMDDWEMGEIVDKQDIIRILIEPRSAYVRAFAGGMGRQMDRTVLAAIGGVAKAGKDGSTSVPLPASQVVAVDYVETGSPSDSSLVVRKLRRAKELLDDAEAGTDNLGKRYIVCSARELSSLLRTTEVTSADFNTVRALVNGEINQFMGFEFIRLPSSYFPQPTTNVRAVYAFVSDGIVFGVGQEPQTRVAEDPTKAFNYRLYMSATFGAVRVEEAKVVQINCSTTTFGS